VFEFDEKNWLETERILPSDSKAHDFFAFSVSLAGSRALVGSIGADDHGTDSGAAYIFSLNEPPMAKDDFFVTETDTQLSANVLTDNGNGPDSDPDNDPIEVTTIGVVAASGVGGTVEILADGTFFYTPPLNVAGLAFFTYAIGDPDGETSSATVTIDVGATRLFGDRFETD
jgi:hypothetical protein